MISLSVNGTQYQTSMPAHTPLIEALRELGLKGTKLGCASGECGACTVVMDDEAICSCLMPLGRAQGCRIETIEGVAGEDSLHPLQIVLHEQGAFQCGFCTPGVVMSLIALLRANLTPSASEIGVALQGNVCRCSGYKKLTEAVLWYVGQDT